MAAKFAGPVAFFFLQQYTCALFSRLITGGSTTPAPLDGSWDLIRNWLPLPVLDSSAPVLYCVLAFFHLTRYKDHKNLGAATSHALKVLVMFLILCSEFPLLTSHSVSGAVSTKKVGFPFFSLSISNLPFSAYGVLFTLLAMLLKEYVEFQADSILWYMIAMFGTVSSGHSNTISMVRSCLLTFITFSFFRSRPKSSDIDESAEICDDDSQFAVSADVGGNTPTYEPFSKEDYFHKERPLSHVEEIRAGHSKRFTQRGRPSLMDLDEQGDLQDESRVPRRRSEIVSSKRANAAKDGDDFGGKYRTRMASKSVNTGRSNAGSKISHRREHRLRSASQDILPRSQALRLCRADYLTLLRDTLTLSNYRDDALFVELRDGSLERGGSYREGWREEGMDFPQMAHTRLGRAGLRIVQECLETCVHEDITGDILDTRPWRGGFGVFCRSLLKIYQVENRKVCLVGVRSYRLPRISMLFHLLGVFPSFAMYTLLQLVSWIPIIGISLPKMSKLHLERLAFYFRHNDLHSAAHVEGTSIADVQDLFARYALMDRQIVLSDDEVGASSHYDTFREIAVLRIGGASARRALNAYYHKVSPRGFIFVDEYDLPGGCKKDVYDFLEESVQHKPEIRVIGDGRRAYWRKMH